MSKLIFYDKSQFYLQNNVKIKFNKLKEENLIFNLDETSVEKSKCANYLSVVRDPITQKVFLYYSNDTSVPFKAKTCFASSFDGVTFKKEILGRIEHKGNMENNLLLSEKCLSNNLFVFYDQNPKVPSMEKWKGIGGLHISWWYLKDNTKDTDPIREKIPKLQYINLKPEVSKKLNHPNDVYNLPHPAFVRYRKAPKKGNPQDPDQTSMFLYLDPRIPEPEYRGNGIHLITSGNGLDWNLDYNNKKPILTGMHPGHYDKLYICSHYDCHPCCFYDPNVDEYKLYLRSNIDYGVRHIQITTSKDLINWTPLKYVTFNPDFKLQSDNYYSANAMPYPGANNLYLAYPPYFKHQTKDPNESFIALAFSKDGYHWNIKDRLIIPDIEPKEKISSFPVANFITSNDNREFYFYEHRYRSKIIPGKSPQLIRHSIRRDGLTSVESKDGYIVLEITIPKKISLNFKTTKNGAMAIALATDENATFYQSQELSGNHLDYLIDDFNTEKYGEKGFLKIIFKGARLFCIDLME